MMLSTKDVEEGERLRDCEDAQLIGWLRDNADALLKSARLAAMVRQLVKDVDYDSSLLDEAWFKIIDAVDAEEMTSERPKDGRPCPGCDEIIPEPWTKHTFVEFTCPQCGHKTQFGPSRAHRPDGETGMPCSACGVVTPYPTQRHTQVMGDCPFCKREYKVCCG